MAHLLPAGVLAQPETGARRRRCPGVPSSPALISAPFGTGLHTAFDFAAGGCAVAAIASWSRGKRYVYRAVTAPAPSVDGVPEGAVPPGRRTGAGLAGAQATPPADSGTGGGWLLCRGGRWRAHV